MIHRNTKILITSLFLVVFHNYDLFAGGVSVRFANIILENLQPGQVYSLLETKKLPFVVINKLDEQNEIEILIESPHSGSLKEGYEAIPDPSWVKAVPSRFVLGPKEEGRADILIFVPEDEKYSSRHYQVSISAQRVPRAGGSGIVIASVVMVYLRFSIGVVSPMTARELKKRDLLKGLDFEITPASLYVTDVSVGKPLNLLKERELSLVLSNRGRKPLKFKFKGLELRKRQGISPGYELGDPSWIRFRKDKLKVGSKKMKDIGITVNIPPGEEHLNKKYAFIISAVITNVGIPIEARARIYVTTAGK